MAITRHDSKEKVATRSSHTSERRGTGAPQRVLVVDDNVDAAELLCELLRTAGHATEMAHDGPDALGKAGRFQPTAALLDIGLPQMDGYELATRLRQQLPDGLTLIALTGYGQSEDRELSRAAGFDAHWVKPVSRVTLFSRFPDCRRTSAP